MALDFSLDRRDNFVFVHLSGSLTLGPQLGKFARQITSLLSTQRVAGVLLDLERIEEIDSSGLGELVILYTASGEAGCPLCLVQPAARVQRLLEMTRLSDLFPQFEDAESAKSWIRSKVRPDRG